MLELINLQIFAIWQGKEELEIMKWEGSGTIAWQLCDTYDEMSD